MNTPVCQIKLVGVALTEYFHCVYKIYSFINQRTARGSSVYFQKFYWFKHSIEMITFKVFLLFSLLTILEGAGVPKIAPVMHKHPHGHSLNVLKFNDDETLRVDYEAFNELFMHPEVKDRNIAAVSIIGAFRKGKSFFMDYCLRFMYANVSEIRNVMKKVSSFKIL